MSDDISNCTVIREFKENLDDNSWNSFFQRIKNNSSLKMANIECSISRNVENRCKNMYREVVPYDFNRFILSTKSIDGSDYINASNVNLRSRNYIITQYPDDRTITLFWSMVWQSKTKSIIMLGKVPDESIKSYFPKLGEEIHIRDPLDYANEIFIIRTDDETSHDGFVQRRLRLHNLENDESINIWHFEFWSWPDHGVPRCMQSFLTFLAVLRQYGIPDQPDCPPIIHCSAGAGRSGTFCLIDIAILMAEKDRSLNNINIPELVEELRCQRMGMIRSFAQLKFCYEAVIEAFIKYGACSDLDHSGSYLRVIDDHHTCANQDMMVPSSSCSDDGGSDSIVYYHLSDECEEEIESDEMNEYTISNDGKCGTMTSSMAVISETEADDEEIHKLDRKEVICNRKLKNQAKIATLSKHLADNSLKRYRLISLSRSLSLSLMEEFNNDYYKSIVIAVGAVLFLGTFCWLKYSPFKNS